jgi:hypothetical protein
MPVARNEWQPSSVAMPAAAARRQISGEFYRDLGPDYFDLKAKAARTRRLVARLQNLGYAVQLTPSAA